MTSPQHPAQHREAIGLASRVRGFVADTLGHRDAFEPSDDVSRAELVEELHVQQEELCVAHEELRQVAEELERTGRVVGEQAAHYRDLFALAPDPFFITDEAGALIELNAAAIDLIGDAGAYGTPVDALVHPEDAALLRALLGRVGPEPERIRVRFHTRTGRVARAGLRAARSKAGREVLWMARIERGSGVDAPPISSGERAVVRQAAGQVSDLTQQLDAAERKVLTERMAREDADGRERVRRWTMAIVAHGLRLPIEHIRRWCSRLRDAEEPSIRALGAEVIRRHTALQSELIEDLLDPSRVAERNLRSRFTAVEPADVARFVVDTFTPFGVDKDIELESGVHALGPLHADAVRLTQALSNMLWVAMDLAHPGAVVVLAGDRTADSVSLIAQWTGTPLRTDQLDWDLTRLGEGHEAHDRVGMSCLVARQLVQLHDGRLRGARGDDDTNLLIATFPASATSILPPSGRRTR